MTIYNQPTQGNENEETTDLIRSVTLSSARLWEEVLDRINRIEQNQEELANAISRLQRELPVGNIKSELAEFSDSFVDHGVSEIESVVSPMQPTSILEMPPPPLGFSEAPSQGLPVSSNVDLDSKLDNLSIPQVSPIDNLLAGEFGLHEPASGDNDPLASLFGTTGAPPPPPPPPPPGFSPEDFAGDNAIGAEPQMPPPPPPPPPGFGDTSFGTTGAPPPPPPPPPPPGFSPEDFAGENAIGAPSPPPPPPGFSPEDFAGENAIGAEPQMPPPPPPPPGFGDTSFGTASAPPPPPPPPPGFSPEDFAGDNAIGATPTTGSGDVESRPEAPPGVLPPIPAPPAPPEPAITPDFFARATRSKK